MKYFLIIIMALLLTDRWFPLPVKALEHPVQQELLSDLINHTQLNYIVPAGRRSFKTERFCKRYLIHECLSNGNAGNVYYVGAPTRAQAKEILWNDLKLLSPKWALAKPPNETDLQINFKGNISLKVVGLKEFKRVQGSRCNGFVVTEWQDCDPAVYDQTVEPMLNDTGGWCVKEGRPFGKNHFYDDYLKGLQGLNGWKSYHWKSGDILTAEQIERAKDNLAEKDFQREYDASFETGSISPYYSYTSLNHKIHEPTNLNPIIVTCDFNATEKPMSWVVGQRTSLINLDVTYWMKSLSYQFTNTITMCGILEDYLKVWLPFKYNNLIFYGDYAGKHQTSNSSFSDWQIIEDYFRNKAKIEKRIKPCKSIRDSIAATNAQLKNTNGLIRQYIDPYECKELIRDWNKAEWKDNSRELKDDNPLISHVCRSVDYYNDFEFPIKKTYTYQ